MNVFDGYLRALRPSSAVLLALAVVAGIAGADYLTGYDMSLASLYLVPIFVVAWPLGVHAAIVMAIICAVAWFLSILFMQPSNMAPLLYFWDGAIQLTIFLLFGVLIAKLKTALEQADERFATVLEGLDAVIWVSQIKSGDVLYANSRFDDAFPAGSSPPVLTSPDEQVEFYDRERGRWYLVESRDLRWVDGRPVRLQLATDISERKRAETLFQAQQEKIQSTARLVMAGELATTVAHELNQPLGAIRNYIMGSIRRLKASNCMEADVLGVLHKAAAQAERASAVIQRLRTMVARRPAQLAPCDINEVIRGLSSMIETEARQRGVEVSLQLSDAISMVRIDRLLIEQVVLNLSRNAIDAMDTTPQSERKMWIRSRSATDGNIVVEVEDRGSGIDAELEKNLFTPFFSTKPHGTGLGLHICRSIVEAHGGHIMISRSEGTGCTFAFSLNPSYV